MKGCSRCRHTSRDSHSSSVPSSYMVRSNPNTASLYILSSRWTSVMLPIPRILYARSCSSSERCHAHYDIMQPQGPNRHPPTSPDGQNSPEDVLRSSSPVTFQSCRVTDMVGDALLGAATEYQRGDVASLVRSGFADMGLSHDTSPDRANYDRLERFEKFSVMAVGQPQTIISSERSSVSPSRFSTAGFVPS